MRVGGKGGLKPPHWGGLDPHRGIYKFFIRDYDEGRGESLIIDKTVACLLYTSPSPRDRQKSRMPSSA